MAAWARDNADAEDFHFITECFFLTATAVDLTLPALHKRLREAQQEEAARGSAAYDRVRAAYDVAL